VPSSTTSLPFFLFASASSAVGSSSFRPLRKTTSALDSTLAALGGGSKVWLLVPSGTTPTMSTLSPATLATMLVIGDTVVTTVSLSLPSPSPAEPAGDCSEDPQADRASAAAATRATVREDRVRAAEIMEPG